MIAVDVSSWQQGRAPVLVRATTSLDETVEAIRSALADDEPFHLLAVVDGLEVEPTAGVWPMLLGRGDALPEFRAVSDRAIANAAQPPPCAAQPTMVIPPMLDAKQLEGREHVLIQTVNREVFAVGAPMAGSISLTRTVIALNSTVQDLKDRLEELTGLGCVGLGCDEF